MNILELILKYSRTRISLTNEKIAQFYNLWHIFEENFEIFLAMKFQNDTVAITIEATIPEMKTLVWLNFWSVFKKILSDDDSPQDPIMTHQKIKNVINAVN